MRCLGGAKAAVPLSSGRATLPLLPPRVAVRQSFTVLRNPGSGLRRAVTPRAAPTAANSSAGSDSAFVKRVPGWKAGLWTFVDVVAILGSVGGALAALLGVVNVTYALSLPLVLPIVSLIAALQREGLISQVQCALPAAARPFPLALLP